MERRRINLSANKDGHGTIGYRTSLPTSWIKQMGFDFDNRNAIIEFDNNRIIIKKERINMLLIKNRDVKYDYERYDYELENGLLLNFSDWNGEAYIRAFDKELNQYNDTTFKAIYRFQEDKIDLDSLEENSPEWIKATEIVGFEEC